MSYAIFRCQGIKTLSDLSQIGPHNQRTKDYYQSNPNIRIKDSINNIELIKCDKKYKEKFLEITKDYKKEHDERMKNIRSDRYKSFDKMVDESKNVVADEMIFTSDNDFFKDMTKEELLRWANESLNFVYEDLGYTKEQVIHATLHLDEATPHIHIVVVPLIKKYDKRANKEKYSISKNSYIKDKIHLSQLQDKYYERLTKAGFKMERGLKDTGVQHLNSRQFKTVVRYYERLAFRSKKEIDSQYYKISSLLQNASKKHIRTTKIVLDNEVYHILLDFIDMYDDKVKKLVEAQEFFKHASSKIYSYHDLEKEYNTLYKRLNNLNNNYEKLEEKNNKLKDFLLQILQTFKDFFREILLSRNEKKRKETMDILKECHQNNYYSSSDLKEISKNTDKEIEINDYLNKEELEKDYDIFE